MSRQEFAPPGAARGLSALQTRIHSRIRRRACEAVGDLVEIDRLVFERAHSRSMKMLSMHRPRPSIEMGMPAPAGER